MKEQRFDRDRGAFIWIVENQSRCNSLAGCKYFDPVFYKAELIDRDGIVVKSVIPDVEGKGKRLRVILSINSSDYK